jgi:RNA polymerase primary sigma factor
MSKSKSNAASELVPLAPASTPRMSRSRVDSDVAPPVAPDSVAPEAIDLDDDAAPGSTSSPTTLLEPEADVVDEEFDVSDVAAELETVDTLRPPALKRQDDTSGDSMLSRYFREMATHPVMGPQEELATAIEVEQAEVAHWVAIFNCVPVAGCALDALERELPTGPDALSLPQIPAMRRLLEKAACKQDRLSHNQERKWKELSASLAQAIRLADTDRLWVARAEDAARGRSPAGADDKDGIDAIEALERDGAVSAEHVTRTAHRKLSAAQAHKHEQLLDETLAASKAAKNKFVKANLRLVVSIARRYNRGRLPLIDLIQEGNIGLMKAVERFDHARGYRFSTYASWWIRHAISRALADKGRAVRIPVHMLDTHNRVVRATQAVVARLGREPSLAELEQETGIPEDKLDKVKGTWSEAPFSLDRPVGDEDGRKFIDFLQDDDMLSPYETLVLQRWSDEVRRLLGTLTPIESRIIRWRFGLDDEDELTLKEIGDKYNLSRERIRQLQEQALGKIRKHMRD